MKNALFVICCLLAPTFLFAQKNDTRSLPSFDKIGISGGFGEVVLQEGNAESISIEGNNIDPDKIITEVKNNSLQIKTKKGAASMRKAKITVTYKNLTALANSGSSDITLLSVIKGDKFEFASSGSGDLKGEFDVQYLDIAISGSSDLSLRGKAENQEIAIAGSGDVDAAELQGSTAKVAITGSGDVKLAVSGKVKTAVSGSGKVSNN